MYNDGNKGGWKILTTYVISTTHPEVSSKIIIINPNRKTPIKVTDLDQTATSVRVHSFDVVLTRSPT